MSPFAFTLLPTFTMALFALSLIYKIYYRSVTTFWAILISAISSNLFAQGYLDLAIYLVLVFLVISLYRAITRPTTDKFITKRYPGKERRKG